MVVPVRGSWEVAEGIVSRWRDQSLDDAIRAMWPDPTDAIHLPLTDTGDGQDGARPGTPFPYVTFKVDRSVATGHSTGKVAGAAQQYLRVPVTFKCYGKSTATVTGKARAIAVAKLLAAAYDPPFKLDMANDKHVATIRESDFCDRADDDEWVWTMIYLFILDATYNAAG